MLRRSSALTRTGHPHPCTVEVDGAALKVAERRKHCTYPEFARGGPQKLLVLGSEIGGRWSAGSPATWAERRPCTGPGARPRRRRRRAQPLAPAALTRDREPS